MHHSNQSVSRSFDITTANHIHLSLKRLAQRRLFNRCPLNDTFFQSCSLLSHVITREANQFVLPLSLSLSPLTLTFDHTHRKYRSVCSLFCHSLSLSPVTMRDFADPPSYAFQDCPKTFSPAYNETYRTNHGPDANSSSFFCWKTTDSYYDTNYDASDAACTSNWLSESTSNSTVDVFSELGLLEYYAPIKIKGECVTNNGDCKITDTLDTVSLNQQQQQQQQHHPNTQSDQQAPIDIHSNTRTLFPSFPSFDDHLKDTTAFVDSVVNNAADTFYTSYTRLNDTCSDSGTITATATAPPTASSVVNNSFHLNIDECIQLDSMVVTDCDGNTYDGEMSDCLNWMTYNETNIRQCKWAGCTMSFNSQESLVSVCVCVMMLSLNVTLIRANT